jgi:hypothetical protein
MNASNDCKIMLTWPLCLCPIYDVAAKIILCRLSPLPNQAYSSLKQRMTQPEAVRELVAGLVIAAASRGELNPDRLRMVALAGFEICRQRGLAASATTSAAS